MQENIIQENNIHETITQYYINECPQKHNYFYCTTRTLNTGVERGHLQYNINPEILKKSIINNIDDENGEIIKNRVSTSFIKNDVWLSHYFKNIE